MPRLIELADMKVCPSTLALRTGDMLIIRAIGCSIVSDTGSLELLGTLVSATIGDDDMILTPSGPPNVILLRASQEGRSRIAIHTGDPYRGPRKTFVDIKVER